MATNGMMRGGAGVMSRLLAINVVTGLLLACALFAGAGCGSDGPVGGQTFKGSVEAGDAERADIQVVVSADGAYVESIRLIYPSSLPWGINTSDDTVSGAADFFNDEEYFFDADELPIVEGRFAWSRATVNDPRCLSAIAGEFTSSDEYSRVTGVMEVLQFTPERIEEVGEFSWTAAVE